MDYTLLIMLLKDLVILPFQEIKLELKDEISKKIIKLSSKKYDNKVLIVSPINNEEDASIDDLPKIGVVAYIKHKIDLSNGNVRVTLRGEKRVKVIEYTSFSDDILSSKVTDIILPRLDSEKEEVLKRNLKEILNKYIDSHPSISNSILKTINDNDDLNFLTDAITTFLPLKINQKLYYMQEINASKRGVSLINDIKKEIKYIELEDELDSKVQYNLTKEQEEYYLKEKLREIEDALHINEDNEIDNYIGELNKLKIDKRSYNNILKEINRLKKSNINSPESVVVRNYLDWIFSLPWNNQSKENLNSKKVISHLNKSHFGLNDIKERIEDYINLKNINKDVSSPIICLVGPPGVGKTTIAFEIANALNREFYKISVGGLNDSSELVGNRRTYLGSMPGKIIQGLRKCNTNNPVFLIDEIDKMVNDYKGNPASSLLDVLDNTQNKMFVDNYIEEPFDLSNILFILTANNKYDIPYTLYDRLEIIELSSYTIFEKIDIAKKYLIPKIQKELNLNKKIIIKDDVLEYLIKNYTDEAGVRNLTRLLKLVITKVITNTKNKASISITNKDIIKYLKEKNIDNNNIIKSAGVVNALAYTNNGGLVLQVEASIYNGKEDVIITGSLGDILKESVEVALSYIKEKEYVNNDYFNNKTIHIHMLDASTKKDGPSCGVSIVTAILSKLLDKKIDSDISFTGEISLKGNILKVGGIKEKVIAAYNNNITKIYIPKSNELDLKEIPDKILKNIDIIKVSNYDQIYKDLFTK